MSESLILEVAEDDVHVVIMDPGVALFTKTNMGSKQTENYTKMMNNCSNTTRKFENVKSALSFVKEPPLELIQDTILFE